MSNVFPCPLNPRERLTHKKGLTIGIDKISYYGIKELQILILTVLSDFGL